MDRNRQTSLPCSNLVQLFAEIAELTSHACSSGFNECSEYKGKPYRCCDREHCEKARQYARAQGVELQETGNTDLPFMSEQGCIVAPHLRPRCALHACSWSWGRSERVLTTPEETEKYNRLREEVERCQLNY